MSEIYKIAFETISGSWSTLPEELKTEIEEFAKEHNGYCEFWYEYSGSMIFEDEDVEIPFEISKAGAGTYIIDLK